jgi:tetratricopeptide (TPR) repeat protein
MLNKVPLSQELLEIVNTPIAGFSERPEPYTKLVILVGVVSIIALVAHLFLRFSRAEDSGAELRHCKTRLARMFSSTLIARLCLLCGAIVIPLIFYVNTKEHYWTAKHTAMLFSGFLGLGAWLVVCTKIPRFRVPFAWPIGLVLASATISSLRAVNTAEGIGYLFAIFGSAGFFYLASQVVTTSKRIHLFVLTLVIVGVIVSVYGLSQSYLLIPSEYVYALENRAPVSTIGNKNYAAYYLDLIMPIAMVFAVSRRNPLQTIFALATYLICYWHFSMCDTRGGTIAMSFGILATIGIVAYFHGRRFRPLMYVLLLAPFLWAALDVANITYSDTQTWGTRLDSGAIKGAVSTALRDALPEEAMPYRRFISTWFFEGNEVVNGLGTRLPLILLGFVLALAAFWWLVTYRKDWQTHLAGAMALAFLPFLFGALSMPPNLTPNQRAAAIIEVFQGSSRDNAETAAQFLGQFSLPMAKAVGPYNDLLLSHHYDAMAVFSLVLFATMALFLLFRHYDRRDGWLPGFAVVGGLAAWFLIFLLLKAGGGFATRLFSEGLFARLDFLGPIELAGIHANRPTFGLLFTGFSFFLFPLLALAGLIGVMQYIPAHYSEEHCRVMRDKALFFGKWGGAVAALLLVVFIWNTGRMKEVRSAMYTTYTQKTLTSSQGEESTRRLVRSLFAGAHTFFNTQAKSKDRKSDGAIGFRLEIYQGCLRKVHDNPIFGIGPGNFKVMHPHPKYETALERRILGKEVLGRKAHNDFLEDLVENGIFGFIGILWMFTLTGALLYRCLKMIHTPRNNTDVFVNTLAWGLCWSMIAIAIHANFEAPLLQPASTYPCWMLFGVAFQLDRIHRRRIAWTAGKVAGEPTLQTTLPRGDEWLAPEPTVASYELPRPAASPAGVAAIFGPLAKPQIAWPVMLALVALINGTILMRQYVGEMWLRWGMVFSEGGVQRYNLVFDAMEKASEVYPQQMETNYILGRYCIDAVSLLYEPWMIRTRTDKYNETVRKQNEEQVAQIESQYGLKVNDLIDYAQLGIDVHKRDIYMNPHYKWAHNNMGVLCDKMAMIQADLAAVATDPEEKTKYQALAAELEAESRKCYAKALEIDDLQVYALFNLGISAYTKDRDFNLAEKFFERTLLADPRKGDVNKYIARCRLMENDFDGVVDAAEALFAWHDEKPTRFKISEEDREEMEQMLYQVALFSRKEGKEETARDALQVLADRYDACRFLPMVATATIQAGSPAEGLEIAKRALAQCPERPAAESIYAQVMANSLMGNKDEALNAFERLIASNARDSFRRSFEEDEAFNLIRDATVFQEYLESSTGTARKKAAPAKTSEATPPAPPIPTVPVPGTAQAVPSQ